MLLILLCARRLEGRDNFKLNFLILVSWQCLFSQPEECCNSRIQTNALVTQSKRLVVNKTMGSRRVSPFIDTNFVSLSWYWKGWLPTRCLKEPKRNSLNIVNNKHEISLSFSFKKQNLSFWGQSACHPQWKGRVMV